MTVNKLETDQARSWRARKTWNKAGYDVPTSFLAKKVFDNQIKQLNLFGVR